MDLNPIPFSTVMRWAEHEEERWDKLVGCWFLHRDYGLLKLEHVRLPYLDFSPDIKKMTWNIESMGGYFKSIKQDSSCPESLVNFDPDKLKNWCKERNLSENEVKNLSETDRDRANILIKAYLNYKIIPRKDQVWLRELEANLLLERYHWRIKYSGEHVNNSKFLCNNEPTEVNHGFWSIGSIHPYLPVSQIPTSERPDDSVRILDFKNGKESAIDYYSKRLDEIL